jgi:hypothetical protein
MFKVSSASLHTFIDTPNCFLEDRVQYSTVHVPSVFCDGILHFCVFLCCNHQVHRELLNTLYICIYMYRVIHKSSGMSDLCCTGAGIVMPKCSMSTERETLKFLSYLTGARYVLSVVSVLVVAQPNLEIKEGLTNYPARARTHTHTHTHIYIYIYIYIYIWVRKCI